MQNLVIVGISDTADRIIRFVERYNLFHVLGCTVNKEYMPKTGMAIVGEIVWKAYSEKLYAYASFVVCRDGKDVKGFAAFYKNVDANQLYVTLICVDKQFQGKGFGGKMLEVLESLKCEGFETIALEVVKTNQAAYHFYKKQGFIEQEDRGKKFLMRKAL